LARACGAKVDLADYQVLQELFERRLGNSYQNYVLVVVVVGLGRKPSV